MKLKRIQRVVIIAAALLAMILSIPGGDVNAQSALSLKNEATKLCLDSNAKGHVYARKCNTGAFQEWEVDYNKDDTTFTLRNAATRLCLDSNTKRQVYTRKCNPGAFQRWYLNNTNGVFRFRNKATDFWLDGNDRGNVYTHKRNEGPYQRWGYEPPDR